MCRIFWLTFHFEGIYFLDYLIHLARGFSANSKAGLIPHGEVELPLETALNPVLEPVQYLAIHSHPLWWTVAASAVAQKREKPA